MTDHDPLCKQRFDPYQPPCPECEIIATGRADEREKVLADLRAKVFDLGFQAHGLIRRYDVLALIDGSNDD